MSQANDDAIVRLETRFRNGKLQVQVDGRWRQNRRWLERCPMCDADLEYRGIEIPSGTTNFWGRCPHCGTETSTYWVGKPRERGDSGQGWLRFRRAQSGY